MAAWDPIAREKVMLAPRKALMIPLESLGWLFVIALLLAAAALVSPLPHDRLDVGQAPVEPHNGRPG